MSKARPAIVVDDRLDDIEYEQAVDTVTDDDYPPVPEAEGGDHDC